MRLLVTGGAGYVGSVVAAALLDAAHAVTVLDDLSTGYREAVPPAARFVRGDVADCRALLAEGGFDAVLHFAAKSLVAESVSRPELYWHNNVSGTLALLTAMDAAGVRRIVFSSTAAVYGEPEFVPITVEHPARPRNPYGASKLAVDQMLTSFADAHGFAAVSLRYFNVAGASGGYGERHDPETHLIPNVLRAAAGDLPQVAVFGRDYDTPDGTAVRDYIHVVDLADAHLRALEKTASQPGAHRIVNLGTGIGSSVLEVLETAARVSSREIPTRDEPRRAGDPAVLVADGRAARELLGWRPSRTLEDMIGDAWRFHTTSLHTTPVDADPRST